MQCKQCGYRLWNLSSDTGGRFCPECGTSYLPGDYDFMPNTVAFCCPHCDQTYYGTDKHGHLEPPQFTCTTCQKMIHMDQMILRPTAGLDEKQTQVEANPWLLRKETGTLKAWYRTVGKSLSSPGALVTASPSCTTTRQAWNFAVTHSALVNLLGWPLIFLFPAALAFIAGGGEASWSILLVALASWVIPTVGILLVMALWSFAIHGMLRLLSDAKEGWGATFQCLCYSSGVLIFAAVPCLGFYIGWIGLLWWPFNVILMLRERHQISSWHAALAVLWLPLLLSGGALGLLVYMMAVMTQ